MTLHIGHIRDCGKTSPICYSMIWYILTRKVQKYMREMSEQRQVVNKSAPGHFGTCVRHFGTKTNRHPDNWALVFFSLILRTKLPIALNQFSNFNHVCSGKDLYHVDSNPDPRSVIDEKKRLILFVFLVMLMFALYTIMLRIVILMFCNPFFCILSFNNCV